MKKVIIIVCVLTVIVTAIATTLIVFNSGGSTTPGGQNQNSSFPEAGSVTGQLSSGQGGTISVVTVDGGSIQTKNFIIDPQTGEYPAPGYYYLGYHSPVAGVSDPTATISPPYIIEYIGQSQYFNIELLREPIGAIRTQAEQYLLAHLGVSEKDLCQFNYIVSVPFWVNIVYTGENLGFSFCPGATVLP